MHRDSRQPATIEYEGMTFRLAQQATIGIVAVGGGRVTELRVSGIELVDFENSGIFGTALRPMAIPVVEIERTDSGTVIRIPRTRIGFERVETARHETLDQRGAVIRREIPSANREVPGVIRRAEIHLDGDFQPVRTIVYVQDPANPRKSLRLNFVAEDGELVLQNQLQIFGRVVLRQFPLLHALFR